MGILLTVALIGLVILAIVGSVRKKEQDEKRRARYRTYAARFGLSYQESGSEVLYKQFTQQNPFGIGHSQEVVNVLIASMDGHPVLGYTYIYKVTTSDGKTTSTQTYYYQVCALALPKALPWMAIYPEGPLGGKLADSLGFADIKLESEAFNDRFRYKAADERYGSAVMPPRMMELMMEGQTGITRIDGRYLLNVIRRQPEPEDIAVRWNFLRDLTEQIPDWVLQEYGR